VCSKHEHSQHKDLPEGGLLGCLVACAGVYAYTLACAALFHTCICL